MSPELKLIIVMSATLLAVGIAALRELILARRAERQLEGEVWMRVGLRELERRGWRPDDLK